MKTYFYTTLVLMLMITACKSDKKQNKPLELEHETSETTPAHTSKNSLDWQGVYQGVLPCADCNGIQTELILKEDLKYEKESKYLGKEDATFSEKGTFKWNDVGNKITLWNSENEESSSYLVGENKLIQLDNNGNKAQGELASNYELTKQMPR